ncbi:MAG: hypothetical protein QNJ18_13955 [Xenococcaceae cyanobacterium MO_167.B52]|nr:hypothetical protein [Xenococcaceae cyanobacterium MO_167.B52]
MGDKRIRGGIATYTYTDSTFSVAAASTTPGGDIGVYGEAAALGSATGYVTSAYSLTNASTYANINVATANAMAGATSFGPSGYNASRSNATSLSTSHPYGHITTELAFSSSIGSI